jgi:muconate cycloisomerase
VRAPAVARERAGPGRARAPRLVAATAYCLRIPFVEEVRHAVSGWTATEALVVRVEDDAGAVGYGEGTPRPYVTGETVEFALAHLRDALWPAVAGRALPAVEPPADWGAVDRLLPLEGPAGARGPGAARAALELAMLDCVLRRAGRGLGELLPPRRTTVVYGGVIAGGSVAAAERQAHWWRLAAVRDVKVKVGFPADVERVRAVRAVLGPEVSLRLDANGAWATPARALRALGALAPLGVALVEQPLPRGPAAELATLRAASPVPIMVDESLVVPEDAEALIAAGAADYANVRVSKHGGLARALLIARRAAAAGLGVQVGCHVGETAILAAAGRHLAAALDAVAFVEGSFGSLLLVEDVGADPVRFGHRGRAPVLHGPGLGVAVVEARLRRYAERVLALGGPR